MMLSHFCVRSLTSARYSDVSTGRDLAWTPGDRSSNRKKSFNSRTLISPSSATFDAVRCRFRWGSSPSSELMMFSQYSRSRSALWKRLLTLHAINIDLTRSVRSGPRRSSQAHQAKTPPIPGFEGDADESSPRRNVSADPVQQIIRQRNDMAR